MGLNHKGDDVSKQNRRMLISSDVNRVQKGKPPRPVISTFSMLLLSIVTSSLLVLNAKVDWISFGVWFFIFVLFATSYGIYKLRQYGKKEITWLQKLARIVESQIESSDDTDLEKAEKLATIFVAKNGTLDQELIDRLAPYVADPARLRRKLSKWFIGDAPYRYFIIAARSMMRAVTAINDSPDSDLKKRFEYVSTRIFHTTRGKTLYAQATCIHTIALLVQRSHTDTRNSVSALSEDKAVLGPANIEHQVGWHDTDPGELDSSDGQIPLRGVTP